MNSEYILTIDNKVNEKLLLRTNVNKFIDENSFQPKLCFDTSMITFLPNGKEIIVGGGLQTIFTYEMRQDIRAFINEDIYNIKYILAENLKFCLDKFDEYGKEKSNNE